MSSWRSALPLPPRPVGRGLAVCGHPPLTEGTCGQGAGLCFTVKLPLYKSLKYLIPITLTYAPGGAGGGVKTLKPIFHYNAKPLALVLCDQFALPIPTCWNMKSLADPMPTPAFGSRLTRVWLAFGSRPNARYPHLLKKGRTYQRSLI